MARTLTQIYTEAVAARNNYLQLTEFQPNLLSSSKLSILNLITYISSVVIYSYEIVLDVFKIDVLNEMSQRMNGTPEYYLRLARLFQFNSATQSGFNMIFNEDTMKVEYETIQENARIIDKAAYQMEDGKIYDMTLKVAKSSGNTGERGLYTRLSDIEMVAFKEYIAQTKFVGAEINCLSSLGDILDVDAIIYYDDTKVTALQAYNQVRQAFINYLDNFNYNSYVYYQNIVDILQNINGISDIEAGVEVKIQSYNDNKQEYEAPVIITNRVRPYSGYLVMINTDGTSNLTYEFCTSLATAKESDKKLKFVPNSAI